MEMGRDFIFLSSKITVDDDCCHEIKRHLFLERKTMIKLDSISKSRDINLPTMICMIFMEKAMIFSVVMYKCESWALKKAEWEKKNLMLLNCGAGEDS